MRDRTTNCGGRPSGVRNATLLTTPKDQPVSPAKELAGSLMHIPDLGATRPSGRKPKLGRKEPHVGPQDRAPGLRRGNFPQAIRVALDAAAPNAATRSTLRVTLPHFPHPSVAGVATRLVRTARRTMIAISPEAARPFQAVRRQLAPARS